MSILIICLKISAGFVPYSEAYYRSQRQRRFLWALPSYRICKQAGKSETKNKLLLFLLTPTYLAQFAAETPWEGIAPEPKSAIQIRPAGHFYLGSEKWPTEVTASSSEAKIQVDRDVPYPSFPPLLTRRLRTMPPVQQRLLLSRVKHPSTKQAQGSHFLSHTLSITHWFLHGLLSFSKTSENFFFR